MGGTMRRVCIAVVLVCCATLSTSCTQNPRPALSERYPSVDGTSTISHEEQGVVIGLEAPPEPYENGKSYEAVLRLSNEGSAPVTVSRRGGDVFNLIATDITGPKVSDARDASGATGSEDVDQVELRPGDSIVETLQFLLPEQGKYRLHALLMVENEQLLPEDLVYLDVTAE